MNVTTAFLASNFFSTPTSPLLDLVRIGSSARAASRMPELARIKADNVTILHTRIMGNNDIRYLPMFHLTSKLSGRGCRTQRVDPWQTVCGSRGPLQRLVRRHVAPISPLTYTTPQLDGLLADACSS